MSTPDAAVIGALGATIIRPPFLAYLDILGDPVRATTWETSLSFTGTGDADLNGHEFLAISPALGSVSGVKRATGGSDTVTATLSGIIGPDSDMLNTLGNETNWKGRVTRLWFLLRNEDGSQIGGIVPFFTGRMMDIAIRGRATEQTVAVTIESYLASLTEASNRTYMDQADFDSTDGSAALSVAVANGASTR